MNQPSQDSALSDEGRPGMLPPRVELIQTGYNPALGRRPSVETMSAQLEFTPDFVPSWKPRRIPLKCIGLTLPEGMDFIPPKEKQENAVRRSPAEEDCSQSTGSQ